MIIISWHGQCQVIWINKISVLSTGLPLGCSSLIFRFLLLACLLCLYYIIHHITFWLCKTNRQSNTQHFEISPKLYFHYLGHISGDAKPQKWGNVAHFDSEEWAFLQIWPSMCTFRKKKEARLSVEKNSKMAAKMVVKISFLTIYCLELI